MRRRIRPFPILLGSFLVIASLGILSTRFFHFNNKVSSQQDFSASANQYLQEHGQDFSLALQTDPRWADKAYGSGSNQNDLATNGCAITSLAMILSYQEKRTVYPTEILEWSGDRYYESGQGTAWSIFPAFAQNYGLTMQDLGKDQAQIQQHLNQNQPIVISVNPGEFTDVGHIMVIKKDLQSDQLIVYDPNDNSDKEHYMQKYSLDQLMPQLANAWVYS
ncbi:C39 family peptidase [Enterococcus hulanensis]|uniref:C39 family peptidase n=1 Tax=Enterococcus hulanensis TaxID=2559929 RepID=A0ABU3F2B8_9ENTE|nr:MULTISPECIES: C39 family peptidase [Enterococcus]MBX8938197.1 C39 family peptidase [Enterococcus gilvus]MDT2601279.1 C39 family peptidase [Enterococcus hulanensis]MDT2610811.1 C39 family peptidase [Enterococcus hulanensis]MDT2618216.1 C39 family peptidase [Enterococcus hulanensis]MDT2629214.1 C39 family peptidase [Enterococcus hulanensis]